MTKLRRLRRPLQGTTLAALLAVLGTCACAGSALAAGGALINVGPALGAGQPAIAVDPSGTAYVVWPQAPSNGAVATTLAYCTLPAGESACSQHGQLTPAGGAADVEAVSVTVDGTTVVVVAQIGGNIESNELKPIQEWTAPDGSATFTAVDGGKSVAQPETGHAANLIVLPGSNSLGWGWGESNGETAEFSAWTGASSLSNPPACSSASCSTATLNAHDSVFGSRAPADYASQTGTNPGVIGVFGAPFTACPSGGTSYVYGSGLQSSTHSYALSYTESPDSAWKPIANIDCGGYNPAVGSGPSGFGELEYDGETQSVVYRPFDQANDSFDESPVTISNEFENEDSVSQDGSGGIYATWSDPDVPGGAAIRFAYSGNGGASWEGPVSLTTGSASPENVTSAVGADGQGWAASIEDISGVDQVYVQPFVKGDAYVAPSGGGTPPPALSPAPSGITTSQSGGGQTGPSISITAGTTGETDQAKISGANATVASGTVHYYLYADSSCDPGVGEVFDGGSSTVTDGVAAPSRPVTEALGPGKYYWQAQYSGDALNGAVTSTCGAEVLNVLPAASASNSATTNGSTVTVTVTCESSEPCTVTVTVTATEVTVAVKASAAGRKKARHTKTITLAGGTFKVSAHSSKKLTVHLTKAGKALLRREHGHLKGTILVADKTAHGIEQSKHDISITTKRK